ncbi:hypothetical protein [Bernardetia sp.]|uniref:hypothetical protein n=1 Tax=Bernardetia sp. TaxID=1937974 RepID=UPI0025BEE493|nr:hypothetical protein [Bernardetia sp.]
MLKRLKRFLIRWLIRLSLLSIVVAGIGFYVSPYKYQTPFYRWLYSYSDYKILLADIKSKQENLKAEYAAAKTKKEKEKVLKNAQQVFEESFEEICKYWYGTKWSYSGTTQIPGKGKIACGYFVSTILRDLGYPIDRIKMAQAASETLIRKTIDKKFIKVRVKKDFGDFMEEVEEMGEGIYILGLDTHIGFLFVDGKSTHFIHSSNSLLKGVRNQLAFSSGTIRRSEYRVVGQLQVKRWLLE